MNITNLQIKNYKSYKDVTLSPGRLNVLVGPNAAGKSNFADALHFMSEVYTHGLEVAVSRKGGYDNIVRRKTRRSSSPLAFSITAEVPNHRGKRKEAEAQLRITHFFSIRAKTSAIRADFCVESERAQIHVVVHGKRKKVFNLAHIERHGDSWKATVSTSLRLSNVKPDWLRVRLHELKMDLQYRRKSVPPTELLVGRGTWMRALELFTHAVGSLRVFQISPTKVREFAASIPNPELDRFGANLPAVVDMLKRDHPKQWGLVLHTMRRITPTLEEIEVDYTAARTLGLYFREEEIGRPLSAHEISDGTMHALAVLLTIVDPRSQALVIEEPEYSVHAWILRNLIKACQQVSEDKQIFLTTHSPVVLNAVDPEDIHIVWRHRGESKIERLLALDPMARELWESGEVGIFDLLDSGDVLQAIPPGPAGT